MNDNAKKWVAALRSGEFKQTQNKLRTPEGDAYCCLGVACELFRRENGGKWGIREERITFNEATNFLPREVRDWLGMPEQNYDGKYHIVSVYGDVESNLAFRNDAGNSFSKIADIIESEPKGLFATQHENI